MEKEITIRKASNDDMRTYFNWANDIEVRSNAINPNPIIFENHEQWFSKRINSSDSFLYYFELKGVPLGQVRFDKEDGSFLIDYSVDATFRYMGLGRVILKLAMKSLFDENVEDVKIRALVKEGNNASRKTFETLGFTQSDVVVIHGLQYQAFYKFLRK
jgi:UDP-2,4-diacetamido-2,4,6-trideoxy-beta-L-altropyranose hydrolase